MYFKHCEDLILQYNTVQQCFAAIILFIVLTILNHTVEPESGVTMLNNTVDNIEGSKTLRAAKHCSIMF